MTDRIRRSTGKIWTNGGPLGWMSNVTWIAKGRSNLSNLSTVCNELECRWMMEKSTDSQMRTS